MRSFFGIVTLLMEPRKVRRTPTLSLEASEQIFTMLPFKDPFEIRASCPICICETTGSIFDVFSAICMASISSEERLEILSPNFIMFFMPVVYLRAE